MVVVGLVPAHRLDPLLYPVQEIDACGHVMVAVFSSLAKADRLATDKGDGGGVEVLLHANAGRSRAVVRPAEDGAVAVEMFQRRPEHRPSPLGSDEIENLLGVPSDPRLPPEYSSTDLRHLLMPYPASEDLWRLRPDFAGLAACGREAGVDTVCAFTQAGEATLVAEVQGPTLEDRGHRWTTYHDGLLVLDGFRRALSAIAGMSASGLCVSVEPCS